MMKNIFKSFALILALIVAMTLSISVLAEGESSDVSTEATSSDVSTEATSSEATSSEAESSEATSSDVASSEAESSAASSEVVSATESSVPEVPSNSASDFAEEEVSNFPWARVITLIVIAVLILVVWVLTKTKTELGQKLNKFFKEYLSEIKKVAWTSPKETMKATGIVISFLVVAAVAIGLLDLAFTQLVKLIAEIFS